MIIESSNNIVGCTQHDHVAIIVAHAQDPKGHKITPQMPIVAFLLLLGPFHGLLLSVLGHSHWSRNSGLQMFVRRHFFSIRCNTKWNHSLMTSLMILGCRKYMLSFKCKHLLLNLTVSRLERPKFGLHVFIFFVYHSYQRNGYIKSFCFFLHAVVFDRR